MYRLLRLGRVQNLLLLEPQGRRAVRAALTSSGWEVHIGRLRTRKAAACVGKCGRRRTNDEVKGAAESLPRDQRSRQVHQG